MRLGSMHARTTVALLLAGSGALSIAAARVRWWPACRPGGYDAPDCLTLQSHTYDYVAPGDPWVPVGNAAELAGLSIGLLAVAVGLLPPLLLRSRPKAALATGAFLFLTLVPIAASTWLYGQADQVVGSSLLVAPFLTWVFLSPIALLVVGGASLVFGEFTPIQLTARFLLVAFLCLSTPLAQVFFAPALVGYMSHDTAPWTEATSGVFLLAAALVAWPATGWRARARWDVAAAQPASQFGQVRS